MIKTQVATLERTGQIHPAQWEGKTRTGKEIYIRYRFDRLIAMVDGKVMVDEHLDLPEQAITTEYILECIQDKIKLTGNVKQEFLHGR